MLVDTPAWLEYLRRGEARRVAALGARRAGSTRAALRLTQGVRLWTLDTLLATIADRHGPGAPSANQDARWLHEARMLDSCSAGFTWRLLGAPDGACRGH